MTPQLICLRRIIKYFSIIAEKLGIAETDVLRKGLKIMDVYADARDENSRLLLEKKNDHTVQELLTL